MSLIFSLEILYLALSTIPSKVERFFKTMEKLIEQVLSNSAVRNAEAMDAFAQTTSDVGTPWAV